MSIKFGLKGPNFAIVTACTTGTHNIGDASRIIEYGDADVMIAGGTEMSTTNCGLGGFAAARALSTRNDDPETASRPWDVDRDGFVLGDGAGVVVLEEYEHAKKRGAYIYGELTGYGMSSDAANTKHFGGLKDYRSSEGREVLVPYRGEVARTIQDLLGGIRSTCTYAGAIKLKQLSKCTTFIRVNNQYNKTYEATTTKM